MTRTVKDCLLLTSCLLLWQIFFLNYPCQVRADDSYNYPLKHGSNPRLLYDQSGKPFFWCGESAASLIVQLSREDVREYFDDRSDKGFNAILVYMVDHTYGQNAPANYYQDLPFTGKAFVSPNEAYFSHVDWVLAEAASRGIMVVLVPFDIAYDCQGAGCGAVREATVADMESYGRYLGNRYKGIPNLLWAVGADTSLTEFVQKITGFVSGLESEDSNHLITTGCGSERLATSCFSNASWLAVNSLYTYNPVYVQAKQAYHYSPTLPFIMAESTYENEHGASAQLIRSEVYYSLLSGGIGFLFGNCPIWHFNTSGAMSFCDNQILSWKTWLDRQGSLDMKRAVQFFTAYTWFDLVPDWNHQVLTGGYGNWGASNYVTAASKVDGSLMIAYLPTNQTVTVNMGIFNGSVTARWFDPRQGTYAVISGSPFAASGSKTFTPGSGGDWLLVLETETTATPIPSPTVSPMPNPAAAADLNGDRVVNLSDLKTVLTNWSKVSDFANADINGDGKVNGLELGLVIKYWLVSW